MACLVLSWTPAAADSHDTAIRPFRVKVPDAELADLKRRLAATRWPDKETVAGYGNDSKQSPTRDDVLDNFTLCCAAHGVP